MYNREEDGFIVRDAKGRKIMHVYADTREEIYESKHSFHNGPSDGGRARMCTDEGDFEIIDVGPIQYNHAGFPTETLCGHRTHWRHAVVLGKPCKPIKWHSVEQIYQRC